MSSYMGNQLSIPQNPVDRWDFIETSDPAVNENPDELYVRWLNKTTGEEFVCIDNTTGANVWVGAPDQSDTEILDQITNVDGSGSGLDADLLDGHDSSYFQAVNSITKTSNYTVQNGESILADTSGGSFTITLPASPSAGDTVEFIDASGTHQTNNLTVSRNGENILGLAEDLTCDIENGRWKMTYYDSTEGWKVNY